jgi:uncharacterized protein YcbK (DUF882 family)
MVRRDDPLNRRRFLALGAAAAATLAFAPNLALARDFGGTARSLAFLNLHTGERLKTTYWAGGDYVPGALDEINHILRDFVVNEVAPIDVRLLDLLVALRAKMQSTEPFEIISGYRSPQTNAMLRAKSNGVAKHSLHMKAMAIDIHLPGRDLASLRNAALDLQMGGVGYYPASNFIHVDVGPVRHW